VIREVVAEVNSRPTSEILSKPTEDSIVESIRKLHPRIWSSAMEQDVREAARAVVRGNLGVETGNFYRVVSRPDDSGKVRAGIIKSFRETPASAIVPGAFAASLLKPDAAKSFFEQTADFKNNPKANARIPATEIPAQWSKP